MQLSTNFLLRVPSYYYTNIYVDFQMFINIKLTKKPTKHIERERERQCWYWRIKADIILISITKNPTYICMYVHTICSLFECICIDLFIVNLNIHMDCNFKCLNSVRFCLIFQFIFIFMYILVSCSTYIFRHSLHTFLYIY